MARLATSWNEIQAGDIIAFKYKSKRTGKSRINAAPIKAPLIVPRPPRMHINNILKDNLISKATGSNDFK